MFNWKKLVASVALAALCCGMGFATPASATSEYNTVRQVSPKLEWVNISPEEYAFRDKATGNSLYIIERRDPQTFAVTCIEEVYKQDPGKLVALWEGYSGGRSTIANVGWINCQMHCCESAYMDEVALHSIHIVKDVADGVGELPNHYEKHIIYNEVDGKRVLAAVVRMNNKPSSEWKIFGGNRRINGTDVRFRAEPNTECRVLGYFANFEPVYVYGLDTLNPEGENPTGWAYVRRKNGEKGFVASQYLINKP